MYFVFVLSNQVMRWRNCHMESRPSEQAGDWRCWQDKGDSRPCSLHESGYQKCQVGRALAGCILFHRNIHEGRDCFCNFLCLVKVAQQKIDKYCKFKGQYGISFLSTFGAVVSLWTWSALQTCGKVWTISSTSTQATAIVWSSEAAGTDRHGSSRTGFHCRAVGRAIVGKLASVELWNRVIYKMCKICYKDHISTGKASS